MKPQTALKLQYSLWDRYTREQIETVRNEWIAAYREITESDSSKKELCDFLTERISRAAELFISRCTESAKSDAVSHDEENGSLDGNFPLGNEADMKLASSFFSVKELAFLQTGLAEQIEPELVFFGFGHGNEKIVKNSARKGILADLRGSTEEAVEYYTTHCRHSKYPDDYVHMRLEALNNKVSFEREARLLLERAAEYKEKETGIRFLRYEFRSYRLVQKVAETEEEKAVVRTCAEQISACFQRALERNYKKIEAYKKRGVTDFGAADWTLTFDENGNFVKVSVVGIDENGMPIYSRHCTEVETSVDRSLILLSRDELKEKLKEFALTPDEQKVWFDGNPDLYALQTAAQGLKQRGPLYGNGNPEPNYDLSGLVGGQLDAAAWQNYAIANGLARPYINYDDTLDRLLKRLQAFLERYEKALRAV